MGQAIRRRSWGSVPEQISLPIAWTVQILLCSSGMSVRQSHVEPPSELVVRSLAAWKVTWALRPRGPDVAVDNRSRQQRSLSDRHRSPLFFVIPPRHYSSTYTSAEGFAACNECDNGRRYFGCGAYFSLRCRLASADQHYTSAYKCVM